MLPVTTRPPKRPGSWGSPFGRPEEIDLSNHPDERPRARAGNGIYVLPKSAWYVECGPGNRTQLYYSLEEFSEHPEHPHPWMARPPEWGHLPTPPPSDSNDVRKMELISPGKAGSVYADGQNVVIEGTGKATIIQVFSS